MWCVFCVCAGVCALAGANRWRVIVWIALAIAFSLLLAMVQLLPAWEAAGTKISEAKYGSGLRDPAMDAPYFVPNFLDTRLSAPPFSGYAPHLYLGVPAFCGLGFLV
jgi:hypothetical protein